MIEDLNINWEEEFEKYPNDVERQWDYFNSKYNQAVEKHVPRKIMTVNGKQIKKFSVPLSEKNLKLIKKKNSLWSKMRKGLADDEQKLNLIGYQHTSVCEIFGPSNIINMLQEE